MIARLLALLCALTLSLVGGAGLAQPAATPAAAAN